MVTITDAEKMEKVERAQRALREFSKMNGSLTTLVRGLTGKSDMQVRITGGTPHTDGRDIYLRPPIALGDQHRHEVLLCDRRDDRGLQRCGACRVREDVVISLFHEIGHNVYDSFQSIPDNEVEDIFTALLRDVAATGGVDVGKRAEKALSRILARRRATGRPLTFGELSPLISPYAPMLHNALEDGRINTRTMQVRPGTQAMFAAQSVEIFENGRESPDGSISLWRDAPPNAQIIIGLLCRIMGYDPSDWLAPEVAEALRDPSLQEWVEAVPEMPDARSTYEALFPILLALKNLGYCLDQYDPEPEPDPEPDQEDTGGDHDTTGEGDDGEESEGAGDEPAQAPDGDGDDRDEDDQDDSSGSPDPGDDSVSDDDAGSDEEGDGADGGSEDLDPGDDDPAEEDELDVEDGSDEGDDPDDDVEGRDDLEEGVDDDDDDEDDGSGDGPDAGEVEGDEDVEGEGTPGDAGSPPDADAEDEPASGGVEDDEDSDDLAADAGDGGDAEDSEPGDGDGSDDSDDAADGLEDAGLDDDDYWSDEDDDWSDEDEDDDEPVEPDDLEEVDVAVDAIRGHGDEHGAPSPAEEAEQEAEEEAMKRAVSQANYFDAPSLNVSTVRVHRDDQHIFGMRFGRSTTVDLTDEYWPNTWRRSSQIENAPESAMAPALAHMRRVFGANRKGKVERNLKRGKVDAGSLAKRAPFNDPRMMRRKTLPGKRDYFVVIGLDCSGSNEGNRTMPLGVSAVAAQADLLDRVGVDFEIYAHSGDYAFSNDEDSVPGWAVDLIEIKTRRQRWDREARRRLDRVQPFGGNVDGHTLEFYRKRLDESAATDKILMYYTDGEMPAANFYEELKVLKRELDLMRRLHYTVAGVGIQSSSPTDHGLPTVLVQSMNDIPEVVRHLERIMVG